MKIATLAFQLLFCAIFLSSLALAQSAKQNEDLGYSLLNRKRVAWPSPESMLNDLRSPNGETRLNAFRLAGLSDQQAHEAVWSNANDGAARFIGQAVIMPSKVQLTYAALGDDASQEAVIAIEARSIQATYAAVAVQIGKRWQRIAVLDCWCKYDMRPDQDMLAEFISLRPAAEPLSDGVQHYDLVVHSSGGGTGIYTQYEAHLRVFHGELRDSISFIRRYYGGDPTGPAPSTTLERRWFTTGPLANGGWGGTLVQAKAVFHTNTLPLIQWEVRSLLDLHLKNLTCTAYRWDGKTFRYVRTNEVVPACQPPEKSR